MRFDEIFKQKHSLFHGVFLILSEFRVESRVEVYMFKMLRITGPDGFLARLFPEFTQEAMVRSKMPEAPQNPIVDYGNGVWRFEFSRHEFPKKLSQFVGEHPELRLITFAHDGSDAFNSFWNNYYFVVFKEKNTK